MPSRPRAMHIFIAGATGTVGTTLIPTLIRNGHTVTGSTRSPHNADRLRALGANVALMDGLDAASVRAAVEAAGPDAIIHQMTSLKGVDFSKPDKAFALTNRLRTEGAEHLLAAANGARFIAQSYAGWPYAQTGGPVKSESDPLDPDPPKGIRETLAAIVKLERLTLEAGGVVMRYGGFYGPGSGIRRGGEQVELLRKRKFPLIGDGGGVWSFVHTEDVAAATLLALEKGRAGEIYNVVDDDPAPVREWLPALAQTVGAKPPRRVPAWLAKLVTSPATVALMTTSRGASNAKARRELGWVPTRPSWRQGFPEAVRGSGREYGA
jgi:nucleoside-diphosphate-sugar epimerase